MDYPAYLETVWHYLPYLVYAFVFLTLLPKSLMRMKRFADANYAANRSKYHRCYGPELCCHALVEEELAAAAGVQARQGKQKPRKAVTRVYPKRQTNHNEHEAQQQQPQNVTTTANNIRRQVNAATIQTRTNVNQIARMFESGNTPTTTVAPAAVAAMTLTPQKRKVNRVQPILPEIRMFAAGDADDDIAAKPSLGSQLSQLLLQQENIENSANLLNRMLDESGDESLPKYQNGHHHHHHQHQHADELASDWHSEAVRQKRNVPPTLNFTRGSSATPSTASPAASSSPLSSSPEPTSPVLLRKPPLSMRSSVEDIFQAIARNAEQPQAPELLYAGCKTLAPVTSIDDILSERRLSRPLSAYSITDLLNEEASAGIEETFVDSLLHALDQS